MNAMFKVSFFFFALFEEIQALLKEKKLHLKKSFRSVLYQAIQLQNV